jgi:MFS family permease
MNQKERILLWSSNIWIFADGMLGPLFAVYVQKIGGGDISNITWAWATYLIATGVFSILVGKISDSYSKEKLMISGYALTAFFTFSYILVSSPAELYLIQVGLGFALALCNSTWYALYSKYSPKGHAGYVWGLADGESKILTGIAIVLGGFVVKVFSFNTLFIVMGLMQTAATLYQLKLLKRRKK